ncbi:MAG: alpha/beta hydrolase [Mesotoga sp.]|uniref:alpha/beta fold hydrolase n=1 Tax=Mesotoga sp. TaxID=2053577 RepID=UPI00261B55CB|nr:alpha/beta hydrolase [Mesotoga sp.]MDD2334083.1 alpha/beta hydrolase [Mesotoga sp.]MDD3680066.1 alpha/beta hydrolase [Mesotoga sp.]MDD4825410.1 alpha/beta hydrolase [Mesotoga sp.]MDD5682534.1 alpha/beta hydrolase [Mesotoga sp.]
MAIIIVLSFLIGVFLAEQVFADGIEDNASFAFMDVNIKGDEKETSVPDRGELGMKRMVVENYARIVDKKIFYLETVGSEGIPVVFVHGNFASSTWFEPSLEILPERFKGYAIDLPSFGRSDRLEEISIDNYANYVIDFILEMEADGVVLVGHSLGGAVAQSVVIKRPDLIDRVILVDPAPPDGLITPEEVYPYLEMYKGNRELLKKALMGVMPTRKEDDFLERLVDDALLMDEKCFVENARALDRYDFSDELKKTEVPHLVIVGKLDQIITEEMARRFEKLVKNIEVKVLQEYGHSVIVENTELFMEMFIDFTD